MAEKKIKEAKIEALPPVEEVKKKRQSGKRKPKPKTEDGQPEDLSLHQQQADEEDDE